MKNYDLSKLPEIKVNKIYTLKRNIVCLFSGKINPVCQNDLQIKRKHFFEAPDHDSEPFTRKKKNKIVLSLLKRSTLLSEHI